MHFNQRAGGLVLDRISRQILSDSRNDSRNDLRSDLPTDTLRFIPNDFGVILDKDSLPQVNASLDNGQSNSASNSQRV